MKQSRQQGIGRQGERWFQARLPRQWVYQRPSEDIGIDGIVILGTDGNISPYEFAVQVKTSESWSIRDGFVVAPGIAVSTVRYWLARLSPTLLVLFDATSGTGYYSWVADLIGDPHDILLGSNAQTVSLKVAAENRLDDAAFREIERTVIRWYMRLGSSLAGGHRAISVLLAIHELTSSAWILQTAQFEIKPADDFEARARATLEFMAHRDVLRSLVSLASALGEGEAGREVVSSAAAYESAIGSFSRSSGEEGGGVAFACNADLMDSMRPRMIMLLNEIVRALAGLATAFGALQVAKPNNGIDTDKPRQ